jgi:hypothetical protein
MSIILTPDLLPLRTTTKRSPKVTINSALPIQKQLHVAVT